MNYFCRFSIVSQSNMFIFPFKIHILQKFIFELIPQGARRTLQTPWKFAEAAKK